MNKLKSPHLPNTLSGLLRVAVADVRRVELDPSYRLDMSRWHEPADPVVKDGAVCQVCMAGAVLAKTCNVAPGMRFEPLDDATPALRRRLWAIDSMRKGDFANAIAELKITVKPSQRRAINRARQVIVEGFLQSCMGTAGMAEPYAYLEAAEILEKAGL